MKKENIYIKIIPYLVVLGLTIWFIYYIRGHQADFMVVRSVNLIYLSLLVFMVLVNIVLQGWIFKIIIQPFNVNLNFFEWFGLSVMTFLGNTIFPFGGFGFRAYYLKKKHNFHYTHFLSTLAAASIIELFMVTIGSLIGQSFLYFNFQTYNPVLLALSTIVFMSCALFLSINLNLPNFKNKVIQKIKNVLDGVAVLKKNHQQIKKIFLAFCFYTIFLCLTFYFAFQALNFKINIFQAFIPAGLSDYSVFINILPASLGFYEGAIVFSAKFFGLTAFDGLVVAALIRIATISWLVILGPIFSYWFFVKSKEETEKNDQIITE